MEPKYPKRISLAHLPTPIESMERLSKHLGGPDLYIKRDDETGLATGGNKTRKLEFLVAEALAQGCDHLVTTGAPQSNHCRQTAAAAARMGLGCTLVLRGDEPAQITGNYLLDELLGAHVYWAGERDNNVVMKDGDGRIAGHGPQTLRHSPGRLQRRRRHRLRLCHAGTDGASWPKQQLNIDFIVFASSSGGTQAGIVLGAQVYGFHGTVLGISVDHPADVLQTQVAALATATATHLGLGAQSLLPHIVVNDDYLGKGYAMVSDLEREAIQLVAQKEGILLDPVYTGRAMGGLIDLIRWGAFTRGQRVLFWHTGGTAALPAFADKIL